MSADHPDRIGGYEILRIIGRGGMGVLYHARDVARHREVALKVMSADALEDAEARARFHHEGRVAAGLHHRNIVKVFEYGEDGDMPFIAMEYLQGQSLAERMAHGEPLPLAAKLDIVIQLCDGLQCLHQEGIVHRDVKPGNVWLLNDGGVKLLDLGIAKHQGLQLTQLGNVMGSAAYMAPEQLAGGSIDGRADIFSAGVVLYELLSGRKPFDADAVPAVMMKVLHEAPPDIRALVPGISPDLALAVETALQKEPSQRYFSAGEFASDLRLARDAGELPLADVPVDGGPVADPEIPIDATVIANRSDTPLLDPILRRTPEVPLPSRPAAPRAAHSSRPLLWVAAAGAIAIVAGIAVLTPGTPAPDFSLDVRSTPAGAEVLVDGAATGQRTPAVVRLTARPGRVGLTLPGYEPVDEAVAPTAEPRMSLQYSLRRLLQVHSEPAGARIVVDGRETGLATPAALPVGEPRPANIEVRLAGYEPAREPVTSAVLERGTISMRLAELPPARPPAPPDAPPAPAAARSSQVTVELLGSYRFSVSGCGVTSPAAGKHSLKVTAPCTLRLRAPEYFLDTMRDIRAIAGGRIELAAPSLGSVQLRSRHQDCTLLVNGRAVGSPPVDLEIAEGSYNATLQCPDGQTLQTRSFDVAAGKSIRRIDDYLR